jgi:hypothetical protein
VIWQQLQAFFWLRWRLLVNQWRRAGAVNLVLMMILVVAALVTALPLFVGSLALGVYLIPKAEPAQLMYAWDGLVVVFLFFWCIGLATELQRSEPLALSKFLHLPVSASGAFLINYLSSFLRLSLIVFVPLMLGFGLALLVVKGVVMLPVLLSVAAFLLMVTALTYQVQGWLAALMSNPRRRRTVVVLVTAIVILLAQLPNLINVFNVLGPRATRNAGDRSSKLTEEFKKVDLALQAREIDAAQADIRRKDIVKNHELMTQQANRETAAQLERTARIVNTIVPVGWLPLGVVFAAERSVAPGLLGFAGMTLIGAASLYRAYRTTVGLYQGEPTSRHVRAVPLARAAVQAPRSRRLLLEARLPGMSEPVSAIALAGMRSLMRSPEAKMMLLTPLIMVPICGSLLFRSGRNIPELVRPLLATGGMLIALLGLVQVMGNQFGFDRDGFRVFVLCAAPRRDILLGKNLALAPVALGLAVLLLLIVQLIAPLRVDHFVAMFPHFVSMFLLFCIMMNVMSIFAPVHIPAGTLRPANPKLTTVLMQLVTTMFFVPMSQALTLFPLGAEVVTRFLGWPSAAPVCLVLTLVECAVITLVYKVSLGWLGSLFQTREQMILESVTKRVA